MASSRNSQHKRRFLAVGLSLVASAAICSAYGYNILGLYLGIGAREKNFNGPLFERIFSDVQHGVLGSNVSGSVTLPAHNASSVEGGKIYVTRKQGLLLVLFPVWIGKGSNLRGYLMCTRPLNPTDTHKDEYTGRHDAIDIHASGPWGPITPEVPVEVILEKKLSPTQYYVSRSLD